MKRGAQSHSNPYRYMRKPENEIKEEDTYNYKTFVMKIYDYTLKKTDKSIDEIFIRGDKQRTNKSNSVFVTKEPDYIQRLDILKRLSSFFCKKGTYCDLIKEVGYNFYHQRYFYITCKYGSVTNKEQISVLELVYYYLASSLSSSKIETLHSLKLFRSVKLTPSEFAHFFQLFMELSLSKGRYSTALLNMIGFECNFICESSILMPPLCCFSDFAIDKESFNDTDVPIKYAKTILVSDEPAEDVVDLPPMKLYVPSSEDKNSNKKGADIDISLRSLIMEQKYNEIIDITDTKLINSSDDSKREELLNCRFLANYKLRNYPEAYRDISESIAIKSTDIKRKARASVWLLAGNKLEALEDIEYHGNTKYISDIVNYLRS